jgi:hypothetical protein
MMQQQQQQQLPAGHRELWAAGGLTAAVQNPSDTVTYSTAHRHIFLSCQRELFNAPNRLHAV